MKHINFNIKEILPGIFHVEFDSQFELAMTFLRAQEMYESDNDDFKDADFKIIDYMIWYAKKRGGFSYTYDWAGFNIPDTYVWKSIDSAIRTGDYNTFDHTMQKIGEEIGKKKFYLISTPSKNKEIKQVKASRSAGYFEGVESSFHHELAHALYYTDNDYREAMQKVVSGIHPKTLNKIYAWLKKKGYHTHIWDDEVQAYFVSGFPDRNARCANHINKCKVIFRNKLYEHK